MTRKFVAPALIVLAVLAIGALVYTFTRATPPTPATATAPPHWITTSATVDGVRPGPDAASVVIHVSLPAGGPGCSRSPRVEPASETPAELATTVQANVVFESANQAQGGCPTQAPAEVPFTLAAPLGDRPLVLNFEAWHPTGTTFARCDKFLGCKPPAEHCAAGWVDRVVFDLDVPVKHLERARKVLACDGSWLVLALNRHVGECPTEGASCVPDSGPSQRVVYSWDPRGWQLETGTKTGTCNEIRAALPKFPAALCAKLP
ncbi:hypothetical protein VSH64_44110 [Amycolatopsis rhabdoformis]|uniref:Uncharacterized protein n=1 Tax=Amycolatopsis rhabdoformis TaxID=1448059 RepID=A0ABZ1I5Z0_9PSEU|nr:hypothetical protein [Amycolatopsis rhabdoformis]WSE29705.1 hypothetical protein VSH64_44110 [Amycolatopsis rhabdoformis]